MVGWLIGVVGFDGVCVVSLWTSLISDMYNMFILMSSNDGSYDDIVVV